MLCALIGSSFWVNNASRLGLPVSTSHSIIGALVGVGLAFTGPSSVNWGDAKHGLGAVVLSWVVSPLVASVLGAALFLATKHFVLLAENPHARALALYPMYVTVTFGVVIFFVTLAGAPALQLSKKDPATGRIEYVNKGAIVGTTVAICVLVYAAAWKARDTEWFKRYIDSLPHGADAHTQAGEAVAGEGEVITKAEEGEGIPLLEKTGDAPAPPAAAAAAAAAPPIVEEAAEEGGLSFAKLRALALSGVSVDVTTPQSAEAQMAHDVGQRFDPKTERLFTACQVFTAAFASLAHGSNDVANAVAPLAVIQQVFRQGGSLVSASTPAPAWCLAYGGLFIDIGLLLMGYRVMRSLGNNVTFHSPSRGYCIELAGLATVLFCSSAGQAVSTTHVITGATVGVGLCNSPFTLKAVNWRMVLVTMFGWVLTLPAAALVSGLTFAALANSPKALHGAAARPGPWNVTAPPPPSPLSATFQTEL